MPIKDNTFYTSHIINSLAKKSLDDEKSFLLLFLSVASPLCEEEKGICINTNVMTEEDCFSELICCFIYLLKKFNSNYDFLWYITKYLEKKVLRNIGSYKSLHSMELKISFDYIKWEDVDYRIDHASRNKTTVFFDKSLFYSKEIFDGLSSIESQIIYSSFYLGYCDFEIADFLGIARETVNIYKNTALKKIRNGILPM